MVDVSQMPEPLTAVLTRYRGPDVAIVEARRAGRPLTRTPSYFHALLISHAQVAEWYQTKFGCQPASDCKLYTEYFASHFKSTGERAARSSSPDFQRALKTLRNDLSEARRRERANPENHTISGTR
jgi:hypothetical protein